MPWWIWLLLALFMLAMIIAGFVYAGLHGYHALKDLGAVGHEVGKRFVRMKQTHDGERQSDPPLCRCCACQSREARASCPRMGQMEAIQQLIHSSVHSWIHCHATTSSSSQHGHQ